MGANAAPTPTVSGAPPRDAPGGASSGLEFSGAGPDLRPQMNDVAMQRNALAQ